MRSAAPGIISNMGAPTAPPPDGYYGCILPGPRMPFSVRINGGDVVEMLLPDGEGFCVKRVEASWSRRTQKGVEMSFTVSGVGKSSQMQFELLHQGGDNWYGHLRFDASMDDRRTPLILAQIREAARTPVKHVDSDGTGFREADV